MTELAREKETDLVIDTIGTTVVFNCNLLHPRMINIFEVMMAKEKNNNLAAIFVSETGPTDRYAEFCKHSKSMIISLPYIVGKGLAAVDEKDVGASLVTTIWINMIHVFLHELHHNVAYAVDWEGTDANQIEEESEAQEYADIVLEKIIAAGDAEIPPLAEIPWFNTQIMSVIIMEIQAGQKEWAGKQKHMIDNGMIFNDGTTNFTSLREYFKVSTEKPELYEKKVETVPVEMESTQEEPASPDSAENAGLFDQPMLPGDASEASQEVVNVVPNTVQTGGDMTQEDNEALEMMEEIAPEPEEEEKPVQNAKAASPSGDPIMNPFGDTPPASVTPRSVMVGSIEMLRGIYVKLHNHMFANCGFNMGSFTKVGMVFTKAILTPEEITMIIGTFTTNNENQAYWETPKLIGGVRGRNFKDATLPGYDLLIQRAGMQRKIRMVVQNPNTGKPPALRAQAGEQITWIIDITDEKHEWLGIIENGVYRCLH